MIYLDHNATTPVVPEARAAVVAALEDGWANPSSGHRAGRRARREVDAAREAIATLIGARDDEVVFTSGATEGINHVIHAAGPGRVLISAVEHPAVAAGLEIRAGRDVESVPVGRDGRVAVADVLARVDAGPKPALVCVMAANNETGILQPVAELCGPLRERGVPFMVDAVQRAGRLPIDFRPDFLILTGHKLGGPKGAGAIVTRADGPALTPLIAGGGQERGRRGGTEPTPAIAGLGAAIRRVIARRDEDAEALRALRDRLAAGLLERLPGSRVVGADAPRLPNTLSYMLPEGVEAEAVMGRLDREGVCVSAGSACHSGLIEPSRVLTAMGLSAAEAFRVLRLSLGYGTDDEAIDRALDLIPAAAAAVR